ncbi:CAP domain-containing protein [Streptomyces erythrochromogenes]|uniref:CAP domain-containing protein n=1 Tax=Streptomyces erythrochromogenes TaxID=285574 RepID=UPI00369D16BA
MGRHGLHAAPRRGGKRGTALRTGLLGVSVAVALGAAAVTTGMVPVGASFPYVGVSTTDTTVKTGAAKATPDSASDSVIDRQGGLASLSGRGSATSSAPAPSTTPPASPSASASASPSASPSAPASPTPSASAPPKASPSTTPPPAPSSSPSTARRTPAARVPAAPVPSTEAPKETEAPKKTEAPAPSAPAPTATATRPSLDTHSAEEAAVVTLVNQERAQAGCGPVRANPPLAALAGAFSKDMAARGFFGHADPEGNTPWDRAAKAGLSGLGGENIARGQGDAESVMRAWMNSPGHKANILNCEFRTLGVGAHFAAGGPWWTQDFGF